LDRHDDVNDDVNDADPHNGLGCDAQRQRSHDRRLGSALRLGRLSRASRPAGRLAAFEDDGEALAYADADRGEPVAAAILM
jgi:hypothetical protein